MHFYIKSVFEDLGLNKILNIFADHFKLLGFLEQMLENTWNFWKLYLGILRNSLET